MAYDIRSTLTEIELYSFTIEGDQPGHKVRDAFDANPLLPGVIVVEGSIYVNMVSRRSFMQQLSRPFGNELFLNRPVTTLIPFAETQTLTFKHDTPIVVAAREAVQREAQFLYEPIVVRTENGEHHMLDVHTLLLAQSQIHELTMNLLERSNRDLEATAHELQRTQARVAESAHKAGMAEIAADILHNLGNALNSLNTSAHLIREQLDRCKLPFLDKLSQLFAGQDVLKNEAQAQKATEGLVKFNKHLQHHHQNAQTEIQHFIHQIERTKKIVQAQEEYVSAEDFLEESDIRTVIRDAVNMQTDMLRSRQVQVEYAFHAQETVSLPKGKLMQVIRHIIRNACEAMDQTAKPRLQISLEIDEAGNISISFKDNGVGIEPSLLAQLFVSGYSTKPNGAGLGLHYCANTMKEMQGEINATSAGIGRGTTITLNLPVAGELEVLD
jgi:signal transduction histidine kinase